MIRRSNKPKAVSEVVHSISEKHNTTETVMSGVVPDYVVSENLRLNRSFQPQYFITPPPVSMELTETGITNEAAYVTVTSTIDAISAAEHFIDVTETRLNKIKGLGLVIILLFTCVCILLIATGACNLAKSEPGTKSFILPGLLVLSTTGVIVSAVLVSGVNKLVYAVGRLKYSIDNLTSRRPSLRGIAQRFMPSINRDEE